MTKYSLTERQQEMLRSIMQGLAERKLATEWYIGYITGSIYADIVPLGGNSLPEIWKQSQSADFDDFVDAGLFRQKGNEKYTLNAQKIIDAVKSNFGEDEQSNPNSTTNSITFAPIWDTPIAVSQFKADIFVMMPFKSEMKHVYDNCMKPAAQSLNMSINRGDDFFTKHTIIKDIWSAIYHCRAVIADCTGKNANVFYELGMTHTVGRPVILIAQNKDDIPFDIRPYRHIIYNDTPEGLIKLVDELKGAIPKILKT